MFKDKHVLEHNVKQTFFITFRAFVSFQSIDGKLDFCLFYRLSSSIHSIEEFRKMLR